MITMQDLQKVSYHLSVNLKYDSESVDMILNYLISKSSLVLINYHLNEPVLFDFEKRCELFWYEIYEKLNPLDVE